MLLKKSLIYLWLVLFVVLTGCTLESNEIRIPDDMTRDGFDGAPIVTIASPLSNATYREGVAVTIQARISHAGADIARVEFLVDNASIANLQSPNTAQADVFSLTQTWPATGAGTHTIAVTAYRADGAMSAPASVMVYVSAPNTTNAQPTNRDMGILTPVDMTPTQAGAVPVVTSTLPPAPVLATPVSTTPTILIEESAMNVRNGPGLNFLAVSRLQIGESAVILGTNLREDWLKIQLPNGIGWIYAPLVTVTGNLSTLPHEIGPATPLPTPTLLPTATSVPVVRTNLVIRNHSVVPAIPKCGEDFELVMEIYNDGDVPTQTGLALIQDSHIASNTVTASSGNGLISVTIAPHTSHHVAVTFNVDTYVNETHRIEWLIDINNEINESNESDNRQVVEYTLAACP